MDDSAEYAEGYAAFEAGYQLYSCPYKSYSRESVDWEPA
jgi:hypothetical protein